MRHYDLVWIEWIDAEHEGEWTTPDIMGQYEISPCESIGWLVSQNKKRIILVSSTSHDKEGAVHQIGNNQIIPRGMIVTMKVLRKADVNTKQKSKKSSGA